MINNRMDVQNVLSQMRQVRSQMQVQNQPQQINNPAQVTQQMNQVNQSGDTTHLSSDTRQGMPSVQGSAPVQGSVPPQDSQDAPRFGEMFKSAIDTVNASQQNANTMRTAYEQGVPGVDLPDVMIAANKAQVSFEATTQVRNRLLEAYKEIMNMPV